MEIWEYRDMGIWGYGDMGIWEYRNMGIWGYGDIGIRDPAGSPLGPRWAQDAVYMRIFGIPSSASHFPHFASHLVGFWGRPGTPIPARRFGRWVPAGPRMLYIYVYFADIAKCCRNLLLAPHDRFDSAMERAAREALHVTAYHPYTLTVGAFCQY